MDTLPDIPPDFGPSRNTEARIDETRFGDGYAIRRPAGINHLTDTRQVNWTLLTQAEFEELHGFLRPRLKVTPFLWQPPWAESAGKWLCTQLSAEEPTSARFARLSATFVEDHNP